MGSNSVKQSAFDREPPEVRDLIMRVVGLIFGLLLMVYGFLLGGEAGNMADLPTLVVVVLTPLSFTFFGHGADLSSAMAVGFFHRPADKSKRMHAAKVLDTLRKSILWTGFVAALIGAINMSHGMDSWEQFGAAFGVLLLAPFYGIVLAQLVVGPIVDRLSVDAE